MKVERYKFPESSFLSMDKDLNLTIEKILSNKRVQKLLFYNTADCLTRDDLTEEETMSLFKNHILIVPRALVTGQDINTIAISFDNFVTNPWNPEFRDNTITFQIMCQYDNWQLDDLQLRPYRIAAELDSMFNNARLSGIGRTEFIGAQMQPLTKDYGGVILSYRVVHGDEDKKNMINPISDDQFIREFNERVNNG